MQFSVRDAVPSRIFVGSTLLHFSTVLLSHIPLFPTEQQLYAASTHFSPSPWAFSLSVVTIQASVMPLQREKGHQAILCVVLASYFFSSLLV